MSVIKPFVDLLKNRLTKSFLSGKTKWSKDDLSIATAGGPRIDSPELLAVLKEWESQGIIRVTDTQLAFLEILQPFPEHLNSTDEKIRLSLNGIKARVNRFFSEGDQVWSKEALRHHLEPGVSIDETQIQSELRRWQDEGFIEFIGRDDVYFKVRKEFS